MYVDYYVLLSLIETVIGFPNFTFQIRVVVLPTGIDADGFSKIEPERGSTMRL